MNDCNFEYLIDTYEEEIYTYIDNVKKDIKKEFEQEIAQLKKVLRKQKNDLYKQKRYIKEIYQAHCNIQYEMEQYLLSNELSIKNKVDLQNIDNIFYLLVNNK